MARFRKPFFRPSRNTWYVQLDGRQINLGAEKDAAFTEYHRLMQDRPKTPMPAGRPLVVVIVDEFLEWCEKHRAADTYRWYKDRLESFCKTIEATLTVDDFKPHHVQKWVDNYPVTLVDGSRRNLIAAVKRAMKWAEEQGYIQHSPITHMKKPACGRKEQIVTLDQYNALLARYVKDQDFIDLITVTWESGCRPQESLRVEARHVDVDGSRWVFPPSEAKGKKIPRVIYLTPKALEITKRLMKKHPTGPLFRNQDGAAWTPDAINCRFQRAKKKLGAKLSLYACRHTFATRALMRGVDCITVATLMGHSDTSTLAKTYQHISQNPEFLKGQLLKAAG